MPSLPSQIGGIPLWGILLFVQSLPFVSALIMSMIAVLPKKEAEPLPGIALGTELGRAK